MRITIQGQGREPVASTPAGSRTGRANVDPLCELQVRLRARLRSLPSDSTERERLGALVELTINGIAAALQATG